MEAISLTGIIEIAARFGSLGLVMIIWWCDMRQMRDILNRYKSDMDEQRRMYENNVELVKKYALLATDLTEIIQLNTQVQTQLVESIRSNMYCPLVREKRM